jgi:uncharacterized protein YbaP (TraB family)
VTPAEIQEMLKVSRDRGPLWAIEKDGRRSYLYGTIHLNKVEWTIPGPTIVKVLREAEAIAVEINITDPVVLQGLTAKPKKEFDLPSEIVERIRRQAERLCIPWAQLEGKGWANILSGLLTTSVRLEGYGAESGVELILLGFALSTQKRIVSLESVEEQRRALWGRTPGDTRISCSACSSTGTQSSPNGSKHYMTPG